MPLSSRRASSEVTVQTAADSYDLVTLAEVKLELGITDGSKDAILQKWITEASEELANECNRVFMLETVSEDFRLNGNYLEKLILSASRRPVVSITSLTVNDDVDGPLDDELYELDEKRGFVWLLDTDGDRRYWGRGYLNVSFSRQDKIVVVYSAGYASVEAVPADLKRACKLLVKSYRAAQGRLDSSLRAEEIPGIMRQEWQTMRGNEEPALPYEVERIIRNYRVPVM